MGVKRIMDPLSILVGTSKSFAALSTLYKSCVSINSRFIVKKIEKFSEKPFDQKVVEDFIKSIGVYQWEEIQDAIIHQLTQAESIVKAGYERNLVESLLTRKVTENEFWRMNFILQQLYTFDIKELERLYNMGSCAEDKKKVFLFYGLLDDEGITNFDDGNLSIGQRYSINEFGWKFVNAIKDT